MLKRTFISSVCWLSLISSATLTANECYPCPDYSSCGYSQGCNWFGEIDFLYWKPLQEGLFIGMNESTTNGNSSLQPIEMDYKWEGGFRVGVGIEPQCSSWAAKLTYTHYDTNLFREDFGSSGQSRAQADPFLNTGTNRTLFPLLGASPRLSNLPGGAGNTSLLTAWKLDFNQLDLTVFRACSLCNNFTFTPFVGLRLFSNHEKLEQEYEISSSGSGLGVFNGIYTSDALLTQDYTSLGIVAGFEADWYVGCGVEIYGSVDLAVVYGKFNVKESINTDSSSANMGRGTESSFSGLDYTGNYSYYSDRLMTDLALGFRWGTDFNGCQRFNIRFGWEEHFYARINQWKPNGFVANIGPNLGLNRQTNNFNAKNGDLYLRGFVLGADVSF